MTGFGPDSNEAAYEPILEARSGLMDLTGEADGNPPITWYTPWLIWEQVSMHMGF